MRKRTYQREQATQYSSHLRSPETLQDTYVLERMPVDIMLCVSDNLNSVSLTCLKYTNTSYVKPSV